MLIIDENISEIEVWRLRERRTPVRLITYSQRPASSEIRTNSFVELSSALSRATAAVSLGSNLRAARAQRPRCWASRELKWRCNAAIISGELSPRIARAIGKPL